MSDDRDDREDGKEESALREVLAAGHEAIEVPSRLPLLPVRDVVLYPGVTVPLAIGRPRSLAALEDAVDGFLIVATQRDATTENPSLEELHPVGCIVRVVRVIDAKREGKQAIVVGRRAHADRAAAARRHLEPAPDRSARRARARVARARRRRGSASCRSRTA